MMDVYAAILAAAHYRQMLGLGLSPGLAAMTFAAWFDRHYLPGVTATNKSWRDDLGRFNAHIRPVIGGLTIGQITKVHLVRLVEGLRPQGNRMNADVVNP